jgi:phospholipid transport system substrate-binding protein
MRARPILLVLCVLLAAPGLARAAPPQEAAAFVDTFVGEALDAMHDKSLSEAVRIARFDALLQRNFDLARIARYVLGRYWAQTGEADRAAFQGLFATWVIRTYASRLAHAKEGAAGKASDAVKITGARAEGDGGAVVASELVQASGPPTPLEWRLAESAGGFKILDITVAGVSMALTEREEIASAIQRDGGTVAALNRAMAEQLGGTADAAQR